jgi:3'(2'), 5'-bisphosphate nucleotidase
VDPLDGTREFAAGHDTFTVNIGLVEGDRAILGVVGVPATGELFAGRLGAGAWKEDAAEGRHAIAARAMPEDGAVVLASRHYSDDPRLDDFLAGYRVERVVKIGSAVKFCRVAEGVADLYPRFGRTMEWDTAAPQAVLEAAGGHLSGWDGLPLRYRKPGWTNPGFLCTGRTPAAR